MYKSLEWRNDYMQDTVLVDDAMLHIQVKLTIRRFDDADSPRDLSP